MFTYGNFSYVMPGVKTPDPPLMRQGNVIFVLSETHIAGYWGRRRGESGETRDRFCLAIAPV